MKIKPPKYNKSKIILDLCGGTGAWSKPYKNNGYDVRVITLPKYDVRIYKPPKKVYGILAAPPCAMFSLARQNAKTPRDFKQGLEIVDACLKIIRTCQLNKGFKFWALENPTSYLRQFIGKPAMTFKPCFFGDNLAKKTDLWGYFNIPSKTKLVSVEIGHHRSSLNYPRNPIKRAITPPGFAAAFFKKNK